MRRERDLRGSGAVDQWWTWNGGQVTIATDRNGDGKPDPASTVVLGNSDDAGAPGAATPPAEATPSPGAAAADAGAEGGAS